MSEENERVRVELLKTRMTGAAALGVRLLRAMKERIRPEARKVVSDMAKYPQPTPGPDLGDPESDLREFCGRLYMGFVGSHQQERVINDSRCTGYHDTRCMWTEICRELSEPMLSYATCARDERAIRSHNPRLAFKKTKVLMKGDELRDRVFYVKSRQPCAARA
jgi:hypothetical protein